MVSLGRNVIATPNRMRCVHHLWAFTWAMFRATVNTGPRASTRTLRDHVQHFALQALQVFGPGLQEISRPGEDTLSGWSGLYIVTSLSIMGAG